MNYSSKILLHILMLSSVGTLYGAAVAATSARVTLPTPGGDSQGGSWYTDEFGPLRSNYSMGDFVRYTVTPGDITPAHPQPGFSGKGLNCYYGMADIPYAKDVYNALSNQYNLYNFVGYLFAGYAALNINPAENNVNNWLVYRQSGQGVKGSLSFDNNPCAAYLIQLVDYGLKATQYSRTAGGLTFSASMDQGQFFLGGQFQRSLANANASCAWNTNTDDGNYVLAVAAIPNGAYAAPYGQFFGARLSHILGAVVNDIPTAANVVTNMPTNTPMPQMAIINGGPYTALTSPTGITTPSTAHFASMKNFITNLSGGGINPLELQYLKSHALPMITRLSTLCSYAISNSASQYNMLEINSNKITGYDNGVVVDIANNTGDVLMVNQVTAAGSFKIGILDEGSNNYFLHTASLMESSSGDPIVANMITIEDTNAHSSVFLQVMNETHLSTLVTTLNTALNTVAGSSGNSFVYNQSTSNTYASPGGAQYLLISNFDPTTLTTAAATVNEVLMYRIQAINIAQFMQQPYFVTVQINKENIGAGVSNNAMVAGVAGSSILYPSIVSVKTCMFQNTFQKNNNSSEFSLIPLLLMPDFILNSKHPVPGLQAHYGIWLMSYAAALTEFKFGCKFGDNHDCLKNSFGLFDIVNQTASASTLIAAPARTVIDASGNLGSGQSLVLQYQTLEQVAQTSTNYFSLIGSDVWDIGNNFHQDIPILNLYAGTKTDANGNVIPVVNQTGGAYINLAVNFTIQPDTSLEFAQDYGHPYANTMLFSLLTSDLQAGVVAELSQPTAGNYQLSFMDTATPANVLSVQKVFLNQTDKSTISINFLNSADVGWTSSVTVPSVGVGKSKTFDLTYASSGTSNILAIKSKRKKVAQAKSKISETAAVNVGNVKTATDHMPSHKIASPKVAALPAKIKKLHEIILKLNQKMNKAKKDKDAKKEDHLQKKLTKDKKKLSKLQAELKAASVVKK
jgi:hypothetical protein